MRALDLSATLAAFERRGPGTDAERRAARRLARELFAQGCKVTTETFWGRPNWALAHAWHVALALAGSLLSVSDPSIGAAMLTLALLSVIADGLTGVSPGRRLTPERASQNVVARPAAPGDRADEAPAPTRLVLTAKYDVPRAGLIYRPALRRLAATLRRSTGPLALGWLAWLSILVAWSLAVAVIRATGPHPAHILGAVQLPPTVALVLTLALLLEAGTAKYGPATEDDAISAAVAIALTSALAAAPLRNVTVELVLQGAGEGNELGMRRYLKAHRRELRQQGAIVLGIATTGRGPAVWWRTDGRLIPIRYTRRLEDLAHTAADDVASPWRTRGGTPALPARTHGLAAITIGTADTAAHPDENALDLLQQFALQLAHEIDAALDPAPSTSEDEPAATPA